MAFGDFYRGKRVFVTGHTGFKGTWMLEWLLALGAEVAGYSLPTSANARFWNQSELRERCRHFEGDVRDLATLSRALKEFRPDVVFHLAAQALVRLSYREPVATYSINIMGTVNLLEAVRELNLPCAVVVVTTDKCYENHEWLHSYRESDPMGGYDPYSSSKGAAELVVSAYRWSYFSNENSLVRLASGRAGNVIGGGDWSEDRIVPDCVRALAKSEAIPVRNKVSTRPWQHVLEPLSGYLLLGATLGGKGQRPGGWSPVSAFNFGPSLNSNRTVAELVTEILKHWPGRWEDKSDPKAVHEATLLNLATDKAHHVLRWRPVWSFEETVAYTIAWYRDDHPERGSAVTKEQISRYTRDALERGVAWAA